MENAFNLSKRLEVVLANVFFDIGSSKYSYKNK
jgi:hypothetical protein